MKQNFINNKRTSHEGTIKIEQYSFYLYEYLFTPLRLGVNYIKTESYNWYKDK